MFRTFVHVVAAVLFTAAMAAGPLFAAESPADGKFEDLAHRYIEQLLAQRPEFATQLGDHRYDDRLNDYSDAHIRQERLLASETLASLRQIPVEQLSAVNNIDYRILQDHLASTLFEIDSLHEQTWNPLVYNVGDAIYALVSRNFAPLPVRLRSVKARLAHIPEVLAQARENLKNPPLVYTQTAILQNQGTISLIRDDLNQFVDQVPEMKAELAPVRAQAVAALDAYGKWLHDDLLPRSHGNFRLGDALFRQKLRYTLSSGLSKEEILQRAMVELKKTQEELYDVALPLYKKMFPNQLDRVNDHRFVVKSVLDRLADQHPTADSIVPQANQELQRCTDFVRTHDLVTLPDEPVKAIVMPEFQRGVIIASCESSGPLEKNGQCYYNIAPPPADWPASRVTSYFRENNDYMLVDLTVHEAMPGHYVQLWHAKQVKTPTMVRAIFDSGLFIEGWAVYAEQMMAEQGNGGPRVHLEQLKMRLRVIINAILDQKIHTENMTQKQAMDLMMKEGYQEEGEAAGKWRRACLTSTQLSTYFVGVTEVNDIRRAYEARHGRGNLKTLHDLMLSFGSIPPKYVRESMGLQPSSSTSINRPSLAR